VSVLSMFIRTMPSGPRSLRSIVAVGYGMVCAERMEAWGRRRSSRVCRKNNAEDWEMDDKDEC